MIAEVFFTFWRFLEIVTLIPTVGMLSYFVNIYNSQNLLTPTSILVLFIVSVLAAVWSIFTLFTYHRSRTNSQFVALIDVCFVGAFIAGTWYLRGIANDNCVGLNPNASWTAGLGIFGAVQYNGYGVTLSKTCAMLKACWAFAIMNCILFLFTAVLAWMAAGSHRRDAVRKETYVRDTHYSRHGHRRSGSHRSHRSSHSGRRAGAAYV